jgi:hypothetical protein
VSLDRGVVQEVLQEISAIISDEKEPILSDRNDRINEALSLGRLRAELIEILGTINADSKLFSSHRGWKAFLGVLLKSLMEKPLERTMPPTSARFAEKLTLRVPNLSNLDQDFVSDNQISEHTVFWEVLVLPTPHTIEGPLVLTEFPEDFDGD